MTLYTIDNHHMVC